MITCYTGGLGSGKTYNLAKLGVWNMHRQRPVFANFHLDNKPFTTGKNKKPYMQATKLNCMEDLMNVPKGSLILLTELHQAIDSKDWRKIPNWFKIYITQSRKFHVDLVFDTQSFYYVCADIRRITSWVYECYSHQFPPWWTRPYQKNNKGKLWYKTPAWWTRFNTYRCYAPDYDRGKIPKKPRKKTFYGSEKIYKCYDTEEIVTFSFRGRNSKKDAEAVKQLKMI